MTSIIIPVYNSEKYIGACIDSVLSQSNGDFELILVDDGSTDESFTICKKYEEQDQRIKVLHKENGGVSSARYEGLKVATGEYVAFVDNDDILLPEFLEKTLELMDNDTDIVVCSSENILSEQISKYMKKHIAEVEKEKEIVIDEYTGIQAAEEMTGFSKYKISKPLWGKLYRRNFLINIHLEQYAEKIPIIYFEDVFALNLILMSAQKVKCFSQVLYIQRAVLDSQSLSGKLSEFYFNQIDSYALQYEYMAEKTMPKAIQSCLDNYDKCLERIWYKLKHDNEVYKNNLAIQESITKRYSEYYDKFLQLDIGKIRKINMILFQKHRKLWEWSLGLFYFNIVTRYKKKRVYAELCKQMK